MRTKLILFSILAMLGACTPTTVTPMNIPKGVPVAESARPRMEETQKGIDRSIEQNIKAQEKIKAQNQALIEQRINISEALIQAEKIKEKALAQQAVTELEAVNLVNELKKIETRNLFLEKENKALGEGIYNQVLVLESTRNHARETMFKLIEKEKEAESRKAREEHLEKSVTLLETANTKLQKDNNNLTKEAASAKVYKRWVIVLAVGSFLSLIGYILLRTYVPLSR
jgi:hypothetical protein